MGLRIKGKKEPVDVLGGTRPVYPEIRGVGEVLGFAYLLPQTTWLAQWNCNSSQDTELASLFAASCTLSVKVNVSLWYFGIPVGFLEKISGIDMLDMI
jgi:hypothetical protein